MLIPFERIVEREIIAKVHSYFIYKEFAIRDEFAMREGNKRDGSE